MPGSNSTTVESSSKSTRTPCGGGAVAIELAGLMTLVSFFAQAGVLESLKVRLEVGRVGTIWMSLVLLG